MSRIEIKEQDFTTPVVVFDTTDVAFIPGFVVPGTGTAERGVPVLCRNLAEFTANFGSNAPTFIADQLYPAGFAPAAIAGLASNIMFKAGDSDPSYVYAKSLLQQGLPVVYERMNVSDADITVDCAYEYFSDLVFTSLRPDVIPYPTMTAWSSTAGYSVGDIVAYNNTTDTPGAGSGISVSTSDTNNYYNTDTAKAYVCVAAVAAPEPEADPNEGPDGNQTSASWEELSRYQDTNNPLMDLGLSVKYITSGGYPTHEYTAGSATMASMLHAIAQERGDCIALIDYVNNPNRKFVGVGSIYESASSFDYPYAAMFAPWIQLETLSVPMPPSYAYLSALANSLKYSANTNAIAGVNRGQVPGLKALNSNYILTNTIAEDGFQPDSGASINGITNIRSYGYRIWGNRTLKANSGGTTATSFLNIRNIVSDIKKIVYTAAMVTLFEPNAQITWINFTSKITPFLDTLVSNYGISKYQIDRVVTQDSGLPLPKTVMAATITIYPVYSIEKISITIAIRDDDTVEVSE